VSLADELAEAMTFWSSFAPVCPDAGGSPSKEDCDDGDMALFNGLLCASGEAAGCDAMRRSQGEDGRFWRSPARVDGNRGKKNSFSRDMAMGVFVYLATTRDQEAASRWLHWIEKNRPCVLKKPFSDGCLIRGPHRLCRDDEDFRCTITPSVWAMFHMVWERLDLEPTEEMSFHASYFDDIADPLAAFTPDGYPSHLVGVHAFLEQILEREGGAGPELAERLADDQPENPFFLYLRDGKTDAVAKQVLALCPAVENGTDFPKHQWSWERATDTHAWEESMGWDCLFMARLLGAQGF
jgi:hypothetical protein